MAVPIRKRLLSNEEYHQMVEGGILAERKRVELIHGEVLEMTPIGNRNAACLRRLLRLLAPAVWPSAADVMLDAQNPLHLPEEQSEPQPDLVLLRSREDGYAAGPPTAADVLLVVEVADSSLAYDRDVKVPLYARSGIPEVWLIDLAGGAVSVHRRPAGGSYRDVQTLRRGDRLAPQALPGAELPLETILG